MSTNMKRNHLDEAKRIVKIIKNENTLSKKDWVFLQSMKAKIQVNDFVTDNQIYWLRDIKDRYLERPENQDRPAFLDYNDKKDNYRD